MYTKDEIFKAVSTVIDPEVGFNLVDLGLIYDATCNEKNEVHVTMTLSTKACPLHQLIVQWVEEAIMRELPEAQLAEVEVVWKPEWNITMASKSVRDALAGKI